MFAGSSTELGPPTTPPGANDCDAAWSRFQARGGPGEGPSLDPVSWLWV